jgi:hypothetical protein
MVVRKKRRFPSTAQATQRRAEREGNSAAYLAAIRQLPCCACGAPSPSDAHHLKAGTGERGMAMKATDRYAVPLCRGPEGCHTGVGGVESVGSKNETAWFAVRGVKPLLLAARLWASWTARKDVSELRRIVASHQLDEGRE